MKKIFRLWKLFTPGLIICSILSSCSVISITITGGDTSTGKLYLKDAEGNAADSFKVYANQIIKWKIGEGANLSITELSEKTGSDNVFRKRARKKLLSTTWKAKVENLETLKEKLKGKEIKDGDDEYFIEDYYIKWKDKKTGASPTYDPRIQVNS